MLSSDGFLVNLMQHKYLLVLIYDDTEMNDANPAIEKLTVHERGADK